MGIIREATDTIIPSPYCHILLLLDLLHLQQRVCKLLASVFPPLEIGTI